MFIIKTRLLTRNFNYFNFKTMFWRQLKELQFLLSWYYFHTNLHYQLLLGVFFSYSKDHISPARSKFAQRTKGKEKRGIRSHLLNLLVIERTFDTKEALEHILFQLLISYEFSYFYRPHSPKLQMHQLQCYFVKD